MKRKSFFSPIQTRQEALKTINGNAWGFMFLGLIQVVISFFLFPELLYDGVIYIVLGALLGLFKGRIVAILLLLASLLGLVSTFTNVMGVTSVGGGNLILAVIIVGGAVKSIEATFKLRGSLADEPAPKVQYSEMVYLQPTAPPEPVQEPKSDDTTVLILISVIGLLLIAIAGVLGYFLFF
ncbi:MAG: hypothetical protein H6651_22810 [Ardenticatenales bacterium]|nr:hypothetical protein [Ardenticatenales bacterium]